MYKKLLTPPSSFHKETWGRVWILLLLLSPHTVPHCQYPWLHNICIIILSPIFRWKEVFLTLLSLILSTVFIVLFTITHGSIESLPSHSSSDYGKYVVVPSPGPTIGKALLYEIILWFKLKWNYDARRNLQILYDIHYNFKGKESRLPPYKISNVSFTKLYT